jgi:hypothetical protein
MKIEVFEGTADTAHGKKLEQTLKFEVRASLYETYQEMVAANDTLSEQEQLDKRNAERRNAATAKSRNAAFDAAGFVKPTIENDEQLRIRSVIKTLMLPRTGKPTKTFEEAKAIAEASLDIVYIA